MKEQWIREGFSTYYTVKKEKDLTYEKDILLHHPLSCLLPCEFRMENEDVFYYYETGIYTLWKDEINQRDGREFFYQMIMAFEQMESYLLDLDHIKLTFDLVFLGENGNPVFCYLPEFERNIFEQLRDFLETCIDRVSHEERRKVCFYYEFHKYLVRDKPNMEQLKEYFIPKSEEEAEIEEEEEAAEFQEQLEREEIVFAEKMRKKYYAILVIFCTAAVAAVIFAGYFLRKIFIYGWYYPVVSGFLISTGLFLGAVAAGLRWRKEKQKSEEPGYSCAEKTDFKEGEEKTELLDCPTVLLAEDILGTLVPQKSDLEEIIILQDGFIIGSSSEGTDYQLEQIGVSRRHLIFRLRKGDVVCEDMGSTNGTRVNGKKIESTVLKHGDKIQIGLELFEFIRP